MPDDLKRERAFLCSASVSKHDGLNLTYSYVAALIFALSENEARGKLVANLPYYKPGFSFDEVNVSDQTDNLENHGWEHHDPA